MSGRGQRPQAEALLEDIRAHYRRYAEDCRGLSASGAPGRSLARLFRHWISYDPQAAEPVHTAFLDGLSALVEELAGVLEAGVREDPAACQAAACQAVELLLDPRPRGAGADHASYLLAAEYQCAPLLPYLPREALERWRAELLRRTPRRMMFPKERELLARIETLMGEP